MEETRTINGLALEELETQRLDLLPDREEMNLVNVNPVVQTNVTPQTAVAVSLFGAHSNAANYANAANVAVVPF